MRRPAFVLLAVCLFATPGTSTLNQPVIITVAGGGPDQVLVGDATIVPLGLILDGSGNLYVTSQGQQRVFRVSPMGLVSVAAGSGVSGHGGACDDGIPAQEACFTNPEASALDASGNLLIADTGNHRVRRVDAATGIVTTLAGTGVPTGAIDGEGGDPSDDLGDGGPAVNATLGGPWGLAVDAAGHLFIADYGGHRVRRVDAVSGVITTIAGTGVEGVSEDGIPADVAALGFPTGLALDAHANLLIADVTSSRIRIVDATTGLIGTVAGNGQPTGWIDGEGGDPSDDLGDGGPAIAATLKYPHGVSVDGSGNILIADTQNSRVRRVDSATGTIVTVAGGAGGAGFIDGPRSDAADDFTDGVPATTTMLSFPGSAVANAAGDIIIADTGNSRLRKVDAATGLIESLSGDAIGDGGHATRAQLVGVLSVATDAAGNLFIADYASQRVRRVDAVSGVITTVAGCVDPSNCDLEYGRPATETSMVNVTSIAISPAGELTIAQGLDLGRVVKVESGSGVVRLVAGNGGRGLDGDGGPATLASIGGPVGLEFDAAGNLFIAQSPIVPLSAVRAVRRVDASTGIITTVAGGGSLEPMDGLPAIAVGLGKIGGITLDPSGNLFITESRVWRVDAITGIIARIAGTGEAVSGGDGGPATEAGLCQPAGLDLDDDGGLLIAEFCGPRVRRVDLSTGIIDTVAGNGEYGFGGDGGTATQARLAGPFAVAIRPSGGFYLSDLPAQRVRLVAVIAPPVANAGPDQVVACTSVTGTPITLDASGSTGALGGSLDYSWAGPFPEGGGTVTGVAPTVSLPIGPSTIALVVNEGGLESTADTVDVRVTVSPQGLSSPLADLVPEGEDPPLPRKAFQRGSTLSLRLSLSCGSTALTDADVSAPTLVALEADGQAIPIPLSAPRGVARIESGVAFEHAGHGMWRLNVGTSDLSAGTYRATIEMPDGLRHVAGFQIRER